MNTIHSKALVQVEGGNTPNWSIAPFFQAQLRSPFANCGRPSECTGPHFDPLHAPSHLRAVDRIPARTKDRAVVCSRHASGRDLRVHVLPDDVALCCHLKHPPRAAVANEGVAVVEPLRAADARAEEGETPDRRGTATRFPSWWGLAQPRASRRCLRCGARRCRR